MLLPTINFSVLKRDDIDFEEVQRKLKDDGWEETGSIRQTVYYFEKTGINLTVIDGPQAVSVLPSGPIRGRMFSNLVGRSNVSNPFGINFNETPEMMKEGKGTPTSMESETENVLNV